MFTRSILLTGLLLLAWPECPAWCGDAAPIKIGLFIPTRGERASEGQAVQRGVEMAVAKVNAAGGLGGRPLRLVIGASDERWSASTGALVRLIYDEDVWAILGAVDGKSAHLAEQVVTRARGRVVLITPWATDPTLTQIRIPWFFRLIPDDRQQATALVKEIFEHRRLRRIAVLAEDHYDARMASEAFMKAAGRAVTLLQYSNREESWASLAERLRQKKTEGWVLFGRPGTAARLVHHLRGQGMDQPLFGPLSLACSEFLKLTGGTSEGAVFVRPGGLQGSGAGPAHQRYDPLTSYAYDSLMVLAEAIQKARLNREAIHSTLAHARLQGITGPVEFDQYGNWQGRVELAYVRQGRFVPLTAFP